VLFAGYCKSVNFIFTVVTEYEKKFSRQKKHELYVALPSYIAIS
jgi:hypothetical protein